MRLLCGDVYQAKGIDDSRRISCDRQSAGNASEGSANFLSDRLQCVA